MDANHRPDFTDSPEPPRLGSSAFIGPVALFPLLAGTAASAITGWGWLLIPATAATAIWMVRRRRTAATRSAIVFRVQNGLLILDEGLTRPVTRFSLRDLLDVKLDSRRVERVVEEVGGIPALRFANARVAPPSDEARIELVLVDSSILLTDRYTSHLDAMEWLPKLRWFLRQHGWVPEEERDASVTDAEAATPTEQDR